MSSRPTSFQEQLVNKDTSAVNLACRSQASGASDVGRIFGNLTNCTIGKINININPAVTMQHSLAVKEEFDDIVKYFRRGSILRETTFVFVLLSCTKVECSCVYIPLVNLLMLILIAIFHRISCGIYSTGNPVEYGFCA